MSANSRAAASAEVSHSSEEKFVMGEVVMVLWMVEREMEVASGGGRRIGCSPSRASHAVGAYSPAASALGLTEETRT